MPHNVNLLTVLFTVCYFIVKGRTHVEYSTLTRNVGGDYLEKVCGNCPAGAVETQGICKCKSPYSVFLRNEGRCKSANDFVNVEEKCLSWKSSVIEVIDPGKGDTYYFIKPYSKYGSCSLKQLISFRNSSTGNWHFFNLTGNKFLITNAKSSPSIQVKVSQQSPNLAMFEGYVMKLRLNCTKRINETITEDSCLLFKVEGKVGIAFTCPSPVPSVTATGTPSMTTTGTPSMTTTGTPSMTTTGTPSMTTTGTPSTTTTETASNPTTTITRTPTVTTTTTPDPATVTTTTTPDPDPSDPAILAAIVVIGTILCLLLIGVFGYFLHQYTILCPCKRRVVLRGREDIMEFDVIRNPGQQSYRIQEEHVYADVADVYPFGDAAKAKGKVTVNLDENPSVVLNPYVQEGVFSSGRPKPDLPLARSKLEGNRRASVESRNVRERDGSPLDEETDRSIVFRNSQVEETSFCYLQKREQDLKQLTKSCGQGDRRICNPHENRSHHGRDEHCDRNEHRDRHGHHDYNERLDHDDSRGLHSPNSQETGHSVVYEGLTNRTRTLSRFSCPSCNDSSDYQRPSTLGHCPHREKENNRVKTQSFYATLTLERGTRESDYATTSFMQDSKELPEYNVLEPEESDQHLTPNEPVNHEYNILEPETPADDVQSDMNETFPNSGFTDKDKDLPIHSSEMKSLENNPVYGFPWKMNNGEPCVRRRASSV